MSPRVRVRNAALPLLTLALGGMALVFVSNVFFYVFYVCLFITGLSFLWVRLTAGRLVVGRDVRSDWVQVGDTLRERFTLTNLSRVSVLWVEIRDRSNLPGYEPSRVESVGGRQYRKWVAQAVCTRRGLFTLGPATVRVGDPFGIFSSQWEQEATRSFLVYPPIYDLPGVTLPRGAVAGASRTSFRTQQITTNVSSVRAYAPGDSLNRIHWPTTARLGELMVKEFDLEPSGNLWIVVDLDRRWHAGDGDESSLEYAVNISASLTHKTLAENRSTGMLAYGKNTVIVAPDKGLRQLRRVLENLAMAELGDLPLPVLLSDMASQFGRGMTVVVVTASADPAWVASLVDLTRRGLTPAAVVLDSRSFGGAHNSAALTDELARFGVASYVIQKGQKFRAIGGQRKRQEPLYRALATGRVMAAAG
jgi:uncharacterized protein (DUF58 family)